MFLYQLQDNGKFIHSDGYGTFRFTKGEGKYFYKNLFLDKGGNRHYIDNGRRIKEDGKGYFDGKGQYHKDGHYKAGHQYGAPSYSSLPQQALALGKFAGEDTAALISLLTSSNRPEADSGGYYQAPSAPTAPTYYGDDSPQAHNAEAEQVTPPAAPAPYPVISPPHASNDRNGYSSQRPPAYPAHAIVSSKSDGRSANNDKEQLEVRETGNEYPSVEGNRQEKSHQTEYSPYRNPPADARRRYNKPETNSNEDWNKRTQRPRHHGGRHYEREPNKRSYNIEEEEEEGFYRPHRDGRRIEHEEQRRVGNADRQTPDLYRSRARGNYYDEDDDDDDESDYYSADSSNRPENIPTVRDPSRQHESQVPVQTTRSHNLNYNPYVIRRPSKLNTFQPLKIYNDEYQPDDITNGQSTRRPERRSREKTSYERVREDSDGDFRLGYRDRDWNRRQSNYNDRRRSGRQERS